MGIQMTLKGDKLVIEVDVSAKAMKTAKPSKSGKTRLVATTEGYQRVDGSDKLKVSLYVTTPNNGDGE